MNCDCASLKFYLKNEKCYLFLYTFYDDLQTYSFKT